VGDEDPSDGALQGGLEVLCEAAASAEPAEGSFHHPPAGQEDKALGGVGPFDDLNRLLAEAMASRSLSPA
jgi:hypothetical protein